MSPLPSFAHSATRLKPARFLSTKSTGDGLAPSGPADLLNLARDRTVEGRVLLADSVSDLLNNNISDRENDLIADILLQIVQDAELDLRRTLAEKLARNANAPHDLMVFLAHDDISVARPILVLSQVLNDQDFIDIVRQRSTYHRRAIARRPALADEVQEVLVLSNDNYAIGELLANDNITINNHVLSMLAETAKQVESLRSPLVNRPEITTDFAIKLYWWVSIELREYIQDRFQIERAQIDHALENTLHAILSKSFHMSDVSPAIQEMAKNLAESKKISSGLLIQVLRRGQIIPFLALFSAWIELPVTAIQSMILSHSGETIALVAKALHIQKADFASLFLLARAGRPGEHVVDPRELSRVLEFYDRLPQSMAQSILGRWKADPAMLQQKNFSMAHLIVETNQSYLQ